MLEVILEDVGQKFEFQPEKSKRGLSVRAVEFFDEDTKRKRVVYVYSPYEELKAYGLNFENREKGKSVSKYTIDMIEENDKLYLQKELSFDETQTINEIIKETDRKNVIFMKYNGEFYALKLEVSRYYYDKLEEAPKFDLNRHLTLHKNFQFFIYKALFGKGKVYKYLIEKSLSFHSQRYPIIILPKAIILGQGVDLYITPELYARNKSFLRNLNEIDPLNVTSAILTIFRTQLNDPDFSVSKIFGFRNAIGYSNYILKFGDLILPDFKIFVKKIHILNFGILRTSKHKRIGEKRAMAGEIVDTVNILGIQNTDYSFLNPIYISINSDIVIKKLTKYKNYRYRFVLQSILFSSNIENLT